jgi:hypothetical protein
LFSLSPSVLAKSFVFSGDESIVVHAFAGALKAFDFNHLATGRSITKEMPVDLPIESGDIVLTLTGCSLPESEDDWTQTIALDY